LTVTDSTEVIAFAEKLLSVLDRGSFNTTYKHAVLLALMDLCMEYSGPGGEPPSKVTTRQLAEKVLEMYWPHSLPYTAATETVVLRQGGSGQSEIISYIVAFRHGQLAIPATTLSQARYETPAQLERLIETIEWKLTQMPLPRLQAVGSLEEPFIYTIGWDANLRRSDFKAPDFDRNVYFIGSAAENLVRLSGLIRPLIQREWAKRVARYNKELLEDARLEEFLFGQVRTMTAALRTPLADLQEGKCFYCDKGLPIRPEIDHFIPWSRYPNDSVENLVASHRYCNARKSDHLAAAPHLEHWDARSHGSGPELIEVARQVRWPTEPDRTRGAVRAIYSGLPEEALLWMKDREFSRVSGQQALIEKVLLRS
jgi:5-methylcytosine-specific restriction endonuclease McrA